MLKNKKMRTALIAALAVCAMGSTIFAASFSETAEIFYNNIKIYLDGGEIVPRDATGNTVEPFTMNGTTYLPVRAIANAFGQDVEWDGATQSIYIGKKDATKPDNYLDRIQYNDYQEADGDNDFAVINGTVTDYSNNIYTSGLLFFVDWPRELADDSDRSDILVAYPLNSQYKTLKGKIVLPKSYDVATWGKRLDIGNSAADVWFYGDGKLLYKATRVTSSMPFSFDINTTGVNQLTVKIKAENGGARIALTDLALYK